MTVRILTPGAEKRNKLVAIKNPGSSPTNIATCVMAALRLKDRAYIWASCANG